MTIVVNFSTAPSLGNLKARIADELARSDLSSQIGLAVVDAIKEAASYRFWFNEVRGLTVNLVAGQETYTSDDISALTEIDAAWINVGGQRRNLYPGNSADIDRAVDGTPPLGEPDTIARYGTGLRLYPVPRQPYVLTLDGVTSLSPLTDDGQSNAWTVDGEKLIRTMAKRELYAHVIQDSEAATGMDTLAGRYLQELLNKTSTRTATGRLASYG